MMKKVLLLLCFLAATIPPLLQGQITETHAFTTTRVVPDGNASGLQDVRNISSAIAQISRVQVRLKINSDFMGDLYAYVRHSSGFCVLLNRPGKTASNAAGTDDSGLDVTFATDHPQMEKKEIGEAKLGGGPVLTRGSIISPVVFNLLRAAADAGGIPYSLQAAGRDTSTDADAIHIAREGIATAVVGVPNRYMHSPNEMVSLDDLDRTATLIADTCRAVDTSTDFTAR